MTTLDGSTISECFSVVSRVGSEVEGLSDTLQNMLVENLSKEASSLPCVLAGNVHWDRGLDTSEWVCCDLAYSFPLKSSGKGKKKTDRWIGFQISTMGKGIAVPDASEPMLHIFFWCVPCTFDDEVCVGFPFPEELGNPYEVVDNKLMLWGGQDVTDWNKREWNYSLKLTALHSPEDLMRHVINPTLALLRGETVESALPDALHALVRYPKKSQLTGEAAAQR
jgi:hypothetical protein